MNTDPREHLAQRLAADHAARPETVAVAITGSLARGMTWAGSDVDLWVFHDGPADFIDGDDGGVYWEVDLRQVHMFDEAGHPDDWLEPYPLDYSGDRLVEALWRARVVHDPTTRLTALVNVIDACMANGAWRRERSDRFLAHGRGELARLTDIDPLRAIVLARRIATEYGLAAWWMRRGALLTSVIRLPEQLREEGGGAIADLYGAIYGLGGQAGADRLLAAWAILPPTIQARYQRDLELEILPAYRLGCFDGVVRYLRDGLPRWESPTIAAPLLGLEPECDAQRIRVLQYVTTFLDLISAYPDGRDS
jgi:predicted nucleotidyltransferase